MRARRVKTINNFNRQILAQKHNATQSHWKFLHVCSIAASATHVGTRTEAIPATIAVTQGHGRALSPIIAIVAGGVATGVAASAMPTESTIAFVGN